MHALIHTLKLILPAIIPSWRFFDFIAPSPRIQYRLTPTPVPATAMPPSRTHNTQANVKDNTDWQEFRPRPQQLSFAQMLGRMLWNPVWNESLFLVSCAERLIDFPTRHSEDEILKRIQRQLHPHKDTDTPPQQLQFRLVFVQRKGHKLKEKVLYHSRIEPLTTEDKA